MLATDAVSSHTLAGDGWNPCWNWRGGKLSEVIRDGGKCRLSAGQGLESPRKPGSGHACERSSVGGSLC